MEKTQFWADQKADEIVERKKYHYLKKEIPKFDRYVVKTSASISGVLHIGRLSDTIRSESVSRVLEERGYNAELIWVAEDMDPLRKIPEGVPDNFEEYIGIPVVNIPDPWGCHNSYAEHHVSKYLEVLHKFVSQDMTTYSMNEEYKKGNFKPYIKSLLENLEGVIEIQNRYREHPLSLGWSPWTPTCENCGKIITSKVKSFEEEKVGYRCEDYNFEKTVAKGCGHEGEANPLRDNGKLMWKGEWAAQWARWNVVSEGAGKEYVVPSSAWWVNGEIVERILDFPMPAPIFYEHLMINGEKMSASLGNVVYPHDWLEVATPELLRFFYNKKLMKTRSFSWQELPNLYDDYDRSARIYSGEEILENEKELKHIKRLYESSQIKEPEKPIPVQFSHVAMLSQIFSNDNKVIESLKRTGHFKEERKDLILERITLARNWARRYVSKKDRIGLLEDFKVAKVKISKEQRTFLKKVGTTLLRERGHQRISRTIYSIRQRKWSCH
ncbi:MAG: lysine--tRNA ligase [Candidatus Hydrothermarchaeales archaeon]